MQIIYMWKQNYYLLNSIPNFSPNNTQKHQNKTSSHLSACPSKKREGHVDEVQQ